MRPPKNPALTDSRYRLKSGITTLSVGATTIAYSGYDNYKTANIAPTQITSITGGLVGMIIRIHAGDNFTSIAHNANIQLKNDVDLPASEFPFDSSITLYYNGTAWVQQIKDDIIYNVRTYGAVGDGVADDTAAINAAAVAIPASGGVLYFPTGTYKVTSTITINKSIKLLGDGRNSSIINASAIASPGYIFRIEGEITATNSVVLANALISQADIDVTDGSKFAVNDYIRVRSEAGFNEEVETHLGEIRQVESIAVNKVTLKEDLADTYNTADTAIVDLLTMLDSVEIQGLKFVGRGKGDTSHWYGVRISQARNVYVHDCWFIDCYSQSIMLWDVVSFGVYNNKIENSFKTGNGYGVVPTNSSRDGYVNNNNFVNCRHAFTTGGNGTYGVVRSVLVDDNTLSYTDLAARIGVLHTHNVSQFITFSNNTGWGTGLVTLNGTDILVEGNRNFQDRAGNSSVTISRYVKRLKVINNQIHDTINEAVLIVRDVSDIEIRGNYIRTEAAKPCIDIGNSLAAGPTEYVSVVNNTLVADNHNGILVESFDQNIDHLTIKGNTIRPAFLGINIKANAAATKKVRYIDVFKNRIVGPTTGISIASSQYACVHNNKIIDGTLGISVTTAILGVTDYNIHPNKIINCTTDILDQPDTEDPNLFANIELLNPTGSNADDGRVTSIRYRGERSPAPTGGFAMLAKTEASKDGVADDDTAKYTISVNGGADGENPTLRTTTDSLGAFTVHGGVLGLDETGTPPAVVSRGKIWASSDNRLNFQDGAGVSYKIPRPNFAGIWTDDNVVVTTILQVDTYARVTIFTVDMPAAISSSDHTTDSVLVGATGNYKLLLFTSGSSAVANKNFQFDTFMINASGDAITDITAANPGVVTATGHSFNDGDHVKISGLTGMDEVEGRIFIVANATADTFELNNNNGANIDTSGYVAYGSGGTAYFALVIGVAHTHRRFGGGGDVGSMSGGGIAALTTGCTLEVHVEGLTDTTNVTLESLMFSIECLD